MNVTIDLEPLINTNDPYILEFVVLAMTAAVCQDPTFTCEDKKVFLSEVKAVAEEFGVK